MSDLVQRLREYQEWGVSREAAALVSEAADELERLTALLAQDIHSCHPNCTRSGCVNARLTRELEEARKDAGWQPIETAPRDGTRVLCVWACAWGEMVYEGWCQSAGTARDGGDFWRSHSLVPVSGRPTHWMPLPPPPQEK